MAVLSRRGSDLPNVITAMPLPLRIVSVLALLVPTVSGPGGAVAGESDAGQVNFFVDHQPEFDAWTTNAGEQTRAWMREHYSRMQVYAGYFDAHVSWYPNAWFYKDSFAIKPDWPIFNTHPEWVLRDAAGEMLYIRFKCSGGTCPQFAADIGNPDFRRWWIEDAKSTMARGYRGIWVDDVNLVWRISDGDGKEVIPVDPRTGKRMRLKDWRRYFAEFMEELRHAIPDAEIVHNIIWHAEPADDPSILRVMDAADFLNLERGISDSGIRRGSGKYGFETFLDLVRRAHARGLQVIMDDHDDDSRQARDYELAFYFLINDGGDLLGAGGDMGRITPANFWSGYEIDLGRATGPAYRWRGLFRRDFECGMVLVNQPETASIRATLPGAFTDLAGSRVTEVTLEGSSGEVLRSSCPGLRAPSPTGGVPTKDSR